MRVVFAFGGEDLEEAQLQHVPTGVNRDSQRTPKERV
jgi:hypothetical protein